MHRTASIILVVLLGLFGTACVVIEDGEVGVSKSFGSISDEPVGQGVVIQVPVVRIVETWDVKLQELKETAQVPSSEGLIVGLDTSLLFQVEPEKAPEIRKTVGWNYVNNLVVPYFRNAVRDVVSGYPVRNIYGEEGRKEIASKIRDFLRENLTPRGIRIVDVLLRDVKLPAKFKDSIEAKLTAQQVVAQKQFELEQARKDAEIEVARARGAAEAENPNVIYVATEANMPIIRNVTGR
jgi:regulator of protease activity HflC (stomatin/prohibitin superfamily)